MGLEVGGQGGTQRTDQGEQGAGETNRQAAPSGPVRENQSGRRIFDVTTVPVSVRKGAADVAQAASYGAINDPTGTGIGALFGAGIALLRKAFGG